MANSYTSLNYHIIFSTRNREPLISQEAEKRIWTYICGIARELGMVPLTIGGVADHIHILLGLPPTIAISEALKRIKGGSSHWIASEIQRGFKWQDGYGAFTVSKSQMPEVASYIQNQREHHKKRSFQDEFQSLLEVHKIEYDERYLWR